MSQDKKIQILDFEKPIYAMQDKINELKKASSTTQINYDSGIESLEEQTKMYKKELYEKLEPYQKLQIARHPQRPNFYDYVHLCVMILLNFTAIDMVVTIKQSQVALLQLMAKALC